MTNPVQRRKARMRAPTRGRARPRGQAVVEMALMSLVLALLLAAAVDFGRAYYTDVVVTNMAAEGAAYASFHPDYDLNVPSCSNYPIDANKNIQARAKRVAQEHGLVIAQGDKDYVVSIASVPDSGNPYACTDRCFNRTIRVQVTYTIHDLFLPRLLGRDSIVITEAASQQIQRDADNATCP